MVKKFVSTVLIWTSMKVYASVSMCRVCIHKCSLKLTSSGGWKFHALVQTENIQ